MIALLAVMLMQDGAQAMSPQDCERRFRFKYAGSDTPNPPPEARADGEIHNRPETFFRPRDHACFAIIHHTITLNGKVVSRWDWLERAGGPQFLGNIRWDGDTMTECEVGETTCASQAEFEALVHTVID